MPEWTPHSLCARLRQMLQAGALRLPPPARGRTPERLWALYQLGREDLSLARLAEAHTDAIAILAESNQPAHADSLYGVWASDGPGSRLDVTAAADGSLRLHGVKRYCSGAGLVDHALATAHENGSVTLLQIPLWLAGVQIVPTGWASAAFAATCTSEVRFDDVHLKPDCRVGGDGWYLQRVGFWHGALGPAACWAGGAAGLLEAARGHPGKSPHTRAQLGALESLCWGMHAVLQQAGREIDADRDDIASARRRALMVRHLIERGCTEALDRFGRITGPQLLAYDAAVARRHAELALYIRQCHAERDLEAIPDRN